MIQVLKTSGQVEIVCLSDTQEVNNFCNSHDIFVKSKRNSMQKR